MGQALRRSPELVMTLKVQLEKAGINIPDQIRVKRMMEACRLGLPLDSTEKRITGAWLRRLVYSPWEYLEWDAYIEESRFVPPDQYFDEWDHSIPLQIIDRVNVIRDATMGAIVLVRSTPRTSWIQAGSEEYPEQYMLGGWVM